MVIVRRGFTAIELLMVVGIALLMAGMTAPFIFSSLKRAAVGNAADAIQRAASQARFLAMSQREEQGKRYGIVIYRPSGGSLEALVTYGASTDPLHVLKDANGRPVGRQVLPANAVLLEDGVPPSSAVGWMYQARIGTIVTSTAPGAVPTDVDKLSLSTLDGRHRAALGVYGCGLVASWSL